MNKEKDTSNHGMKKPKMPSIFKMATNFAKDLAKYVAEGAPNVSHKAYTERLEACSKCPYLIKESMRCGKCGCLLEHKAKWRTTTCPDTPSRWDPMYLSPDDMIKIETAKNLVEEEDEKKVKEQKDAYAKKIKKWGDALNKAYDEGKWHPTKHVDMDKAKFKIDPETFIPDDRYEQGPKPEPKEPGKGKKGKRDKGVQKGLRNRSSKKKNT